MTGQHTKTNEHIEALYAHVKDGHEFEQPIGIVNRLLEEAGKGVFTWPQKVTAHRIQDTLLEIRRSATLESLTRESALALWELGVRVRGQHAA